MKPVRTILGVALFLSACAWEAGRVIEIKLSPVADRLALIDGLRAVARELGMVVESPDVGPAGVEYRATYQKTSLTLDFHISVLEVGNQVSILIRTLNVQTVDPSLAERAFELFRVELDKRGMKYEVRRD